MVHQAGTIGIIRQRGQLTVPDSIRDETGWLAPNSVVKIRKNSARQLVVEPYSTAQKPLDWEELRKKMERIRSFKGRGKPVSLSEFIVKDRETHF